MAQNTLSAAPQVYARTAGALYLVVIICGFFAEAFVRGALIVPGDAAASAHRILASPTFWNVGVAANLIVVLCAIPLLWIEYHLLRPVNRQLMLLAVFFNLVSFSSETASKLFLLLVLPILGDADYLKAFDQHQLQVLANIALKSHDVAFNIALVLFAFVCFVNGFLIFKSGYLPKLVGVLMQLAGASYLIGCFAALCAPRFATEISPIIFLPALIGELSFCLWLLIKGVNVTEWKARVNLTPEFSRVS